MVQTVIDVEGHVNEPRIVSASYTTPLQVFGVLSAMRQWRFKPAMLHGAPVPVLYALTTSAWSN